MRPPSFERRLRTLRLRHPAVEVLESRVLRTVGMLDPSFGSGGMADIPLDTDVSDNTAFRPGSQIVGSYVLSDGKILEVIDGAWAATSTVTEGSSTLVLLRLNPDGSPDTSFGPNGQILETADTRFPVGLYVSDTAMQSDGKFLLVGAIGPIPRGGEEPSQLMVERLNADGSLDTTFDDTGPALAPSGGGVISVEADGKIAIATSVPDPEFPGEFHPAFLRLNPDGSPDTTFGPDQDGEVVLNAFTSTSDASYPSLLAVQGDDIVSVLEYSGALDVIRLNAQGRLDPGFGDGGIASYPSSAITPHLLTIDPEGRILLVGDNGSDFLLARLDASGQPDTTFGAPGDDGMVAVSFGFRISSATALDFESGGRILVAGTIGAADMEDDLALARLDDDGTLDASFGNGGLAITSTEIFATSVLTFDPQDRVVEALVGSDDVGQAAALVDRFLTADVAPTPPEVTNFRTIVKHGRITALLLTFSEAMDASPASMMSSYLLVRAGRHGKFDTRDAKALRLRSASYQAATHTVTLEPRGRLSRRSLYQLTVYAADLSDLAGNLLAGEGNGVAGTNGVVTFGGRTRVS